MNKNRAIACVAASLALLCVGCGSAQPKLEAASAPVAAAPVKSPPAAVPVPAMAVPEEKAKKPEAVAEVKKKSCDCDTAETELPDLCPDASCRACKASCGIPGH